MFHELKYEPRATGFSKDMLILIDEKQPIPIDPDLHTRWE